MLTLVLCYDKIDVREAGIKMELNEKISGFTLVSKEDAPEISAKINIFLHEKSRAELCFIEREDSNLSFAISFATPPKDDTGVFHIIEHSVLCGSKKFPVKEPFVELLKGSLNTFLNAMTYEDKTVYPVSSRCEADFYNLVDVYLDAVFHPLMLSDKCIFEQEGHHLEYDRETDTLNISGVVFNEMQGAYSSPDELGGAMLSRLLFEGSTYGHDSGGSPDSIPDLTYDEFVAAHQKYYRPENSLIVIDGSVNLDKTLELIDSYLSEFSPISGRVNATLPNAKIAPPERIYYEAAEGDGKARLMISSVTSEARDKEAVLASAVISDALLGSNEAPLKRALLDSGLCDDVSIYANKSLLNTLTLELHGIKEENADILVNLLKDSIEKLANAGIDKSLLRATLGRMKFRQRERDFGAFPRGVAYAISVLEGWHYGISPLECLTSEATLSKLEEYINTDFYEKTLLKMTLNSTHRASLLMLPTDAPSEMSRKLSEREALLKESMTDEDLKAIILNDEALKERQAAPDTDEALATIPALSLSDIKVSDCDKTPEIKLVDGAKILRHKADIKGILYTELYFSAKNLTDEELTDLSLLTSLFTNLDTENMSARDLKNEIKTSLGCFSPISIAYTDVDDGSAIPLLLLKVSSLTENAEVAKRLISEVLLKTNYKHPEKIKEILTQIRSATEDIVLASGDGISTERIEGAISDAGASNEEIMGLAAYRRLKNLEASFDKESDTLIPRLEALAKRIFNKNNLILSVAGDEPYGFGEAVAALFPDGNDEQKVLPQVAKERHECVVLPIRVAHTAMGLCSEEARDNLGAFKVAGNILSYEYLWGNVRVMGGAYGSSMTTRRYGGVILSSYRDPSPKRTLEIFAGAADFLRDFLSESPDLTKYIIGAVGEYDIIKTPRTLASQATADYITGWSAEKEQRLISDMLTCTKNDLYKVADVLDGFKKNPSFTVVCGKDIAAGINGAEKVLP